jgi:hypothetical protein
VVLDKQLTWYRLVSSQSVLALVPRSWDVPSPKKGSKERRRRLLLYVPYLYEMPYCQLTSCCSNTKLYMALRHLLHRRQ